MNGIINENELTIVKKYEFDNPLIQNIKSLFNTCYRDCHDKYFHTFKYKGICNLNFTNVINNELVNFEISDTSLNITELKKIKKCSTKRFYI